MEEDQISGRLWRGRAPRIQRLDYAARTRDDPLVRYGSRKARKYAV
jgi:hypothetical protein